MFELASFIDRGKLRRMAGSRYFERGEDYCAGGQVLALAEYEATITAKVQGTTLYRVKLWVDGKNLGHSCTCPIGGDGMFCKHCVAVGLAWLKNKDQKNPDEPSVTMRDVREYLARQEKDALVGLLMERAMEDDRFRQRLLMQAAKKSPKGVDRSTYRHAIDDAVGSGEFVDYHSMHDYARGIDEVIDSIEELLKEGHAAEVVEIAEHALAAIERAMNSVDDSDGRMGGIFERLQGLHHAACIKAKPDPEALAKRLFAWELRTDWDTFYGAVDSYADVLGDRGLDVYRKLAQIEWARVPAIGAGRDDIEKYGKRFRITRIMELLARRTGDVEALVAVKERDLSTAYAYLQIAEAYRQARRHDLALEWAERGVKAFPERTDSRLREFLAEEYHRRSRHDDALDLIWAEFAERPTLEQFKNLKSHADRGGPWRPWRERALAHVRDQVAKAERDSANRWSWSARAGHSELVRIFLWEKDVDAAWQEAKQGGCSNDLWLELAAKREKDRPEDALSIYLERIAPTVRLANNDAYHAAIGLLRKARALMIRLGRREEFDRYVKTLRAAHKPKRNFIKMLDRAEW